METLRNLWAWLYMSEAQAAEEGFTNHGRLFSVPCWVADDDFGPMVAAKFAPFEIWLSICTAATQFISLFGADVGFAIAIGAPISAKESKK